MSEYSGEHLCGMTEGILGRNGALIVPQKLYPSEILRIPQSPSYMLHYNYFQQEETQEPEGRWDKDRDDQQ